MLKYINSNPAKTCTPNWHALSLAGSNQRQILNFFPLPKDSNEMVYHRFKKPIILKTVPGSVFHISLVDENFNHIKADVGKPTLLALKKKFWG